MSIENEGESLLDIVNAAIPNEDPPEANEPEEEAAEEAPEGEEAAENEEAEGDETPEGDEGEEKAEGEEADAEEGEAEEDGEGKPGKKAEEKELTDEDILNAPIPRGTLVPTQKRITSLIGMVKERDTQLAEVTERANQGEELIQRITDTGLDGDRFAVLLEYARGVNGGTYEGMRASFDIMQKEMAALAKALGEPLPGVNPIAAHADLMKAIEEKKITPELAWETAVERNRKAAAAALGQANQGRQASVAQNAQAEAQAKQAFTQLGQRLAQKDGAAEYKRKAQLVVDMFHDAIMALPPGKRVAAFQRAYDKVPAVQKAAPAAVKPKGGMPKNQPMRGNKVPAGSQKKSPKSLLEAIGPAFEN